MELHEYPRPTNDTGIGIHWCPGYASAVGMNRIRELWLAELRELGVKWVKIFNHDGALDFAELLLAEGLMPIVRIYRPTPNPSRLGVKEVVQLDALIRAGVRYFEFNSEPDQDSEWRGGRVPANGIDLVVENTIANVETILERGGMPGIPAVSNGSRWDLIGKIIAHGRKDLFAGPVWQAIHNFPRNRPLDYPYDIGNQEGAAYTYRFYQVVQNEEWGENAWRGRTLEDVNRLRRDRCAPGATIADDPAGWLAYEYFDARIRNHLGRSLPILATECGYLVGEDIDPRYPATTPDLHMAQTLEACRIMMGVSERFKPAPDYFFCAAFWLLANAQLGSNSPWWENHAWYSERWPNGALPIVWALKAEPKVAQRVLHTEASELVTLLGTVAHAGGQGTVVLERNGVERARVELDAQSRYEIPGLLPGSYVVHLLGNEIAQPVELNAGQREVVVNLDAKPQRETLSRSQISGAVRGGSGAVVSLVRSGDGQEWVAMARNDGSFRFVDLPAGLYSVRVNPDGSRADKLVLDGANQLTVNLAVAGWGYTIRPLERDNAGSERVRNIASIFCSVEGQKHVEVRAHAGDWSSEPVLTGSAADIGPYACEIGPLEAGHYIVSVEGLTDEQDKQLMLEARVHVNKKQAPLVEFVHSRANTTAAVAEASITVRIIGDLRSNGATLIRLLDEQAQQQEQPLQADRTATFTGLAAGLYAVEVVGHPEIEGKGDIALDGQNHVVVELTAPVISRQQRSASAPRQSSIVGCAPNAAGQRVRLTDALGNEWTAVAGQDDRFAFHELGAGQYCVDLEMGYHQADLQLDGVNSWEIQFAELLPTWEAEVVNAGSMPGYSVVRVEVEDQVDLPVHIWKEEWEGMMRRTGSKPEIGPFALEFSPLGPGHYMVEPEGLGVWTDVTLTGLETVWINFRRCTTPSAPNVVRAYQEEPPTAEEPASPAAAAPPYLFIVTPPEDPHTLIGLLAFVAKHQPRIGNTLEDALKAERVIIVGDKAVKDHADRLEHVASVLRAASVQVESFAQYLNGGLERSPQRPAQSNGAPDW